MSAYTLRPIERSDIPALGELLYESKLALTINRLLFRGWPNEGVQRQNYTAAVEGLFSTGTESLTVVDNESGDIIGHLALRRNRPAETGIDQSTSAKEATDNGQEESQIPEYFNPVVLEAVMSAVAGLSHDVKNIDHYELVYIIVKLGYRGRGIGRDLMQYVFNKAKAAGIPVALNSEPQVYGYFLNHGFKDTKYVDFDLAQWAPPFSGFGLFRLSALLWGSLDSDNTGASSS